MTTFHMSGDIIGAIRNESLGSLKAFTNDDGKPATTEEVLKFFQEEMLKGHAFYVFGNCDNRLPNGRCGGHERTLKCTDEGCLDRSNDMGICMREEGPCDRQNS